MGDLQGHDFRGNQWTGGGGALAGHEDLHALAGSPRVEVTSKNDTRLEFGVGGYYEPDTHTVVVPEGASPAVVTHELGHALDQHLGMDKNTPFTATADFGVAYRIDQERMDVYDRQLLGRTSYFGKRLEAFAEAVAVARTGEGAGVRGERFTRSFPRVLALVKEKLSGQPRSTWTPPTRVR